MKLFCQLSQCAYDPVIGASIGSGASGSITWLPCLRDMTLALCRKKHPEAFECPPKVDFSGTWIQGKDLRNSLWEMQLTTSDEKVRDYDNLPVLVSEAAGVVSLFVETLDVLHGIQWNADRARKLADFFVTGLETPVTL